MPFCREFRHSGRLAHDHRAWADDFLLKYGHLRPGTYDILSRYDKSPELYFDWENPPRLNLPSPFSVTLPQMREVASYSSHIN